MRNLKRALSLLLSSTLVLGMLVMGGSAAGYKDVDASNDHQEAIEVLQAVGIMTGDQNGNFNPEGSITRNEMAVIMAHLLNLNYDYYRGTNPFTDVPEWAAPYVAACAAEGVVAGIGNGQFGGDQKVTAAQASLMIMKALGYFQNAEDFGTDWQVATIRQASYINLFDNISSNAESALTRAQVAQLVLNGLKANMVDFTGDLGIQIGDVTVGYKAEYTAKTNAAAKYNSIVGGTTDIASNNQYYVQLGEELYNGDLKLSNDGTDVFGRPSRVWEYKGDEVGTYAKKELIRETYTSGIEGGDIYTDIGAAACDYDLTYWVDGIKLDKDATADEAEKLVRNNDDPMASTGNGVLTEVYVDTAAEETTFVVINTYLAFATADYNTANDYLPVNVYSYNQATKALDVDAEYSVRLYQDDFDVEDYADGTALLVTIANKEVQSIAEPSFMEACKVTKFSQSSGTNTQGRTTSLTTDGKTYDYNRSAQWDDALNMYDAQKLTDTTYDIYLDQYGYAIGVAVHDETLKYVFITAIDYVNSNLTNVTANASAIFPDGTMDTITVKVKDTNDKIDAADKKANSDVETDTGIYTNITSQTTDPENTDAAAWNTWYSYTEKDGKYVLTPVADQGHQTNSAQDAEINSSKSVLRDGAYTSGTVSAYGNANSVYITVDTDTIAPAAGKQVVAVDDVTSTTTGIKNVDLLVPAAGGSVQTRGVYFIWDSKDYVIAAIVVGEDNNLTKDFAYIVNGFANDEEYNDVDYFWTYDAIVDGVFTDELTEQGDWSDLNGNTGMYRVWYNTDGKVVKAESVTGKDYTAAAPKNIVRGDTSIVEMLNKDTQLVQKNETLYVDSNNANGIVMADDAKFVVIYDDGNKVTVDDTIGNLKSALAVADNDKTTSDVIEYKGDIVAELNDRGEATVLILDCSVNALDDGNGNDNNSSDIRVKKVDTVNRVVTLNVNDKPSDPSVADAKADIMTAVQAALAEAGYEWTTWNASNDFGADSWNVQVDAVKTNASNTQEFTFTVVWG